MKADDSTTVAADVSRDAHAALGAWARSGLMLLTGAEDGTPLLPMRDYLARVDALCRTLSMHSARFGHAIAPSAMLLVERAALLGLKRGGAASASRRSRILRAADGYIALTLARAEDIELLPAWLGCDADDPPWHAVAQRAQDRPAEELVDTGQLLGLPVGRVHEQCAPAAPVRSHRLRSEHRACAAEHTPLVLDFSSLWAGPLCGHLLQLAGARVIKVESTRRPDGARGGTSAFFDLLHGGQEMLALDFHSPEARARLRELVQRADVVIEASRPRAFEHLGLSPEECVRDNPALTWVSITAYGRHGPRSNRIGFGDDVAAAAGLVAHDRRGDPCFIGDALADPITGLAAASGALAGLASGGGWFVDAAMFDAAAYVAGAVPLEVSDATVHARGDTWALSWGTEHILASAPCARSAQRRAAGVGAHTAQLLRELT